MSSKNNLGQIYLTSGISDIKNNEEKIKFFSETENGPGKRKTLKQPENTNIECAVFMQFTQ